MFNKYRIPRESLLNRTGDVTPDGEYESSFSDPQKILGNIIKLIINEEIKIYIFFFYQYLTAD